MLEASVPSRVIGDCPFVSVVIPAFNEENNIGRCLDSLGDVDWPKSRLEAIVVDNGSTDKTVEIASEFHAALDVKVIVLPKANISALRNAGVRRSQGAIIAFLDADCTVQAGWVRAGVRHFQDVTIGVAGCSHTLPPVSSWVARAWHVGIEKNRSLGERKCLPSGNMFVAKADFIELGGFDESLVTNEDYELCIRYRRHGFRVYSDPAISAAHYGIPLTIRAFIAQQCWHGTHVLKVFKRNACRIRSARDMAVFKAVYYGLYSMVMHFWLIGELLNGALRAEFVPRLLIPVGGLVVSAFLMALQTARAGGGGPSLVVQLSYLYYLYGIARAGSSLRFWRVVD